MADTTKIEWTHRPGTKGCTWNPIRAENADTGKVGWYCEHVCEACRHCYAEARNKNTFFGNGLPYKPGAKGDVNVFLDEDMLLQPLRWRKPRTIFGFSMTDLFGWWVPDDALDRIFAVAALCERHVFIFLTKRHQRMHSYLSDPATIERIKAQYNAIVLDEIGLDADAEGLVAHIHWPLPNVWMGVTAGNQKTADERIPLLLSTPASIRFVSCEPMLGPIDLTCISRLHEIGHMRPLDGRFNKLNWVICGGETGKNARPMHPDWARSLRDQCRVAGVPFFFKQNGEWAPGEIVGPNTRSIPCATWFDQRWLFETAPPAHPDDHIDDEPTVFRCGKRHTGRLLDGVEHDEFPTTTPAMTLANSGE